MASQQILTKADPDDTEIFKWNVKKLKQYITSHSTDDTVDLSTIEDKYRLRFVAMDCIEWTCDRIDKLHPKCRGFLMEKDIIKSKLSKAQIETYINPKSDQTQARQQIIDEIVQIFDAKNSENDQAQIDKNAIDKTDTSNAIQERTVALNNEKDNNNNDESDDDLSSVSTHDSMPSLMSDDESDESDDDNESDESDSDENDDALLGFDHEEKKQNKAIKPPNIKAKKTNKKNDDFMSGLTQGFLSNKKGKKKQTKKKKQDTTQSKKNENKTAKNNNNKNTISNSKNVHAKNKETVKIKKKEEIKMELGYHFRPFEIEANKNSTGNIFVCIGPRKESADLTQFKYLKCWVSLKFKLKKKGKKKPLHFSVLIDLRNATDMQREIDRDTLKMGFENVVSFNLNPNHNILNITENNNETKLNLGDALIQYKDEFGVLVNQIQIQKQKEIQTKTDEIEIESDDINEMKQEILKKPINTNNNNNNKSEIISENKKDVPKPKPTQNIPKPTQNSSHITCPLMNDCRLNSNDLSNLLSDHSMEETITNGTYYVRALYNNKYRIGKIEQIMDFPQYTFNNIKTKKGFQISNGKSKNNKKFSQISNDDFNEKEMHAWIHKMNKNNVTLPNQADLNNSAITLNIIRTAKELAAKKAKDQQSQPKPVIITTTTNDTLQLQPGSAPPGFTSPISASDHQNDDNANIATLNADNLAQLASINENVHVMNPLLQQYIEAINAGYHCFWCIPSPDVAKDSVYIALLLMKTSKNEPILREAEQYAMQLSADITHCEIREMEEKNKNNNNNMAQNNKNEDNYWKARGTIFDCKTPANAWKLFSQCNNELLPKAYGKGAPSNFVRYVSKEFGEAYMAIQLLPKGHINKPKPRKNLKNRPQGPKYKYTGRVGEPSIATMSEAPDEVERGEYDHSLFGDDDTRSQISHVSHMSRISMMSNKTSSKYDQFANKFKNYNSHQMHRNPIGTVFTVNDRVWYHGKEYDVMRVKNQNHIVIENDEESMTVPGSVLKKIS